MTQVQGLGQVPSFGDSTFKVIEKVLAFFQLYYIRSFRKVQFYSWAHPFAQNLDQPLKCPQWTMDAVAAVNLSELSVPSDSSVACPQCMQWLQSSVSIHLPLVSYNLLLAILG